jgi:hypothetical protein
VPGQHHHRSLGKDGDRSPITDDVTPEFGGVGANRFQDFEMEASAMYKKIKTFEFESLRKISEKQKIHMLTRHF